MKVLITGLIISVLSVGCARLNTPEFEGYFTYGHEVSSFRICNDSKVYWLNGDDMAVIEQASLSLADVRHEPYQPVYIKFSGFFDDRVAVGFAEDYDGLIYLDKLLSYTEKVPSDCN